MAGISPLDPNQSGEFSMKATDSAPKCPVASQSFFDPEVQRYPFELYRHLRREKPVFWSDELKCFVVTTYSLINEVIRDTDVYSSLGTQDLIVNEAAAARIRAIRAAGYPQVPFLATNDPPGHGMYRRLTNKLFHARRIGAMQTNVEALVNRLHAAMAASGGGEFMAGFATPLPVMVIADLLGVPSADWRTYRAWGDAYVAPMNGVISVEREIECAQLGRDYQDYFVGVIADRRANPRDDLISEMVHTPIPGEDRTMDVPELLAAIQQFLVAGGETTTYALGNGMLILAQNPELAERLRASETRLQTFVEEVLRLRSPSQGLYRRVLKDTVLGGVKIPIGSFVNIRIAAANRDETIFEDADTLDIDRRNSIRHLAFGSGIHTCMGAKLARIELVCAFQQFLSKSAVELNETAGGYAYFPSTFFMGFEHLHLTVKPREA
jgi:cytochrome P450